MTLEYFESEFSNATNDIYLETAILNAYQANKIDEATNMAGKLRQVQLIELQHYYLLGRK